jgi:hypothetical protein
LKPVQQVDGGGIVRRNPGRGKPAQHKASEQQDSRSGQRLAADAAACAG